METKNIPVFTLNEFSEIIRNDPSLLNKHPCIVKDFVQKWPAYKSWNDYGYLATRFGDLPVRAGAPQFITGHGQRLFEVETKFGKYIQYVQNANMVDSLFDGEWIKGGLDEFKKQSLPLYSGNISFARTPQDEVFKEITPYAPLGIDIWNEHLPYFYLLRNHLWLYLSKKGALTPLHEDALGVVGYLGQVRGLKRAILFSPNDRDHFYNTEFGFIEPLNPNYDHFPSFDKAQAWVGDIPNGSMLIFGPYWAHHVTTVEESITIGLDIVNSTNLHIYADADEWPEVLAKKGRETRLGAIAYAEVMNRGDDPENNVVLGRTMMKHVLEKELKTSRDAIAAKVKKDFHSLLLDEVIPRGSASIYARLKESSPS